MEISKLKHDTTAMSEGRWFSYPKDNSVRVLIASVYGDRFGEVLRELQREKADQLKPRPGADGERCESDEEFEKRSSTVQAELWIEATKRSILLGWDGLTEDGEPWTFTTERAVEILESPEWQEFGEWIVGCAGRRFGLSEEELGNSRTASAPNLPEADNLIKAPELSETAG